MTPVWTALRKHRYTGVAALGLWLSSSLAAHRSAADEPPGLHSLLKLPLPDDPGVRVHRFHLPLARLQVDVVDLHYEVPLADALGDGDLVINGGYWGWLNDSKRRIIGLLRAGGKEWSPLRAALDGGVLQLHAGQASIAPARGYQGPTDAELAVQCRPRLVEAKTLVPDLNAHRRAARTAVCVRDAGHTLDVYLTEPNDLGPSLHDLGRWLLEQGCESALALDGGPSTAAGFHDQGKLMRVGPGLALPYALRFKYAR